MTMVEEEEEEVIQAVIMIITTIQTVIEDILLTTVILDMTGDLVHHSKLVHGMVKIPNGREMNIREAGCLITGEPRQRDMLMMMITGIT